MAQQTYITPAELAETFDVRSLQQLASDTGTPVDHLTDPNVANAIERGSADVEKASFVGGRYTEQDLADLQADDDWTLKGLTARLAIAHLYRRRVGGTVPEDVRLMLDQAKKDLKALSDGEEIFRHAPSIEAGVARVSVIPAGQRRNLDLASDLPSFPPRRDRVY